MKYTGIIYIIINKINDKRYVGQTTETLEHRWNTHLWNAKNCKFHYPIYRAINKYGENNFVIHKIDEIYHNNKKKLKHNLLKLETYYISIFDSFSDWKLGGYNLIMGETGRVIISKSTRLKLSKLSCGKNNAFYGKKHSNLSKEKISKANKIKSSKYYKITYKNKKTEIIHGILEFAKQNNYSSSCFYEIMSGKTKKHKDIINVEKLSKSYSLEAKNSV